MDIYMYEKRLEELFVRYPSVQNKGFGSAYKPGLEHMLEFAARLGHPEQRFKSIHVAGTNGKGSVANMLAAALSATGLRVGLYTSPHIIDFRERMRIIDGRRYAEAELISREECKEELSICEECRAELISRESVWEFITTREREFEELSLSFFEITTGMAFWWFAEREVDVAVIEVGLGGRLDSTNIITPELSIITSIGLDHCALLGNTRAKIAAEKAGIFKRGVPALVGAWDEETAPVFESAAAAVGAALTFADSDATAGRADALAAANQVCNSECTSAARGRELAQILAQMDLRGAYQEQNLRTTLTALELMGIKVSAARGEAADGAGVAGEAEARGEGERSRAGVSGCEAAGGAAGKAKSGEETARCEAESRAATSGGEEAHSEAAASGAEAEAQKKSTAVLRAICSAARVMGFHGRWEMIAREPDIICDIGHNPPALTQNFSQLRGYLRSGRYSAIVIVYGVMADKDLSGILPLMPEDATYICVAPATPRALKADALYAECRSYWEAKNRDTSRLHLASSVAEGIKKARAIANNQNKTLIYIGGSTFVVSEAVSNSGIL